MEMIIRKIRKENEDLKTFTSNLGSSSDTFTYFRSRSFDVLDNHILTVLGCVKNNPIAYGHLDKDGDTVWLGVCVVGSEVGKGYGKKIMDFLIDSANKKKLDLKLSVKKENEVAIKLYKNYDFNIVSQDKINMFMEKKYEN